MKANGPAHVGRSSARRDNGGSFQPAHDEQGAQSATVRITIRLAICRQCEAVSGMEEARDVCGRERSPRFGMSGLDVDAKNGRVKFESSTP